MPRKFVLIFLLFFTNALHAQKIPAVSIDSVLHYVNGSKEETVIINFWATFCKPCLEEIPGFIEISKKYEKVKMVFVSLDGKDAFPKKIRAIAKRKNFSEQTIWWLNETDADYFCPKIDKSWSGSIPATLIVNQKNGYRNFVEDKINPNELESFIRKSISL